MSRMSRWRTDGGRRNGGGVGGVKLLPRPARIGVCGRVTFLVSRASAGRPPSLRQAGDFFLEQRLGARGKGPVRDNTALSSPTWLSASATESSAAGRHAAIELPSLHHHRKPSLNPDSTRSAHTNTRSLIRSSVSLTLACLWLMWGITYTAQLNPLISEFVSCVWDGVGRKQDGTSRRQCDVPICWRDGPAHRLSHMSSGWSARAEAPSRRSPAALSRAPTFSALSLPRPPPHPRPPSAPFAPTDTPSTKAWRPASECWALIDTCMI